jgi:hypothetical protein
MAHEAISVFVEAERIKNLKFQDVTPFERVLCSAPKRAFSQRSKAIRMMTGAQRAMKFAPGSGDTKTRIM